MAVVLTHSTFNLIIRAFIFAVVATITIYISVIIAIADGVIIAKPLRMRCTRDEAIFITAQLTTITY